MARSICSEEDCGIVAHGVGLCRKHYQRAEYARKKASGIKNPRNGQVEDVDAFWKFVKKELKIG